MAWHEFMSGELYNLVIILAKEEGTSFNETAELVNQMLIDKLDEIQSAIIELRALSQNNNDITPSQIAAIEQYIIGCTSLISATHEYHSKSARFQLWFYMESNSTLELNSMGLYGLGPDQQPNTMGFKDIYRV